MIYNAYCFSPEIISNRISDPSFFLQLLVPSTVGSSHHVLLDRNEQLWLDYLESTRNDFLAFTNVQYWRQALDNHPNKILLSDIGEQDEITPNEVSEIAIKAPVTCSRFIVTSVNNEYSEHIEKLMSNGVHLISEFNLLESSREQQNSVTYNPTTFYHHLVDALSIIASTRSNQLENVHNDHLRNLLRYKGYDVYDQTRMGVSQSRLNAGSLDLAIRSEQRWVTIIEPLRLAGWSKSNVLTHYNKLIDNYNPLGLLHTHLIVYYIGPNSNFINLYNTYKNFINDLSSEDFESPITLQEVSEPAFEYQNVRSFIHQGTINGQDFICTHYCVNFI
ncbi:hypothetical protein [Aeromonas veronii]|uniref:hypothetical protein n=1 Tax=Aeromonas TaxID=642 RepID=UPI0031FE324A